MHSVRQRAHLGAGLAVRRAALHSKLNISPRSRKALSFWVEMYRRFLLLINKGARSLYTLAHCSHYLALNGLTQHDAGAASLCRAPVL